MSVPKRFALLRFFGSLLKVLAWIFLVLSIIGAVGMAIAGSSLTLPLPDALTIDPALVSAGGGVLAGLLTLILGLFYFVLFYALGENIHMTLAVEENTRLTAALLLRMHQESQVEPTSSYSPGGFSTEGFSTEPFEG